VVESTLRLRQISTFPVVGTVGGGVRRIGNPRIARIRPHDARKVGTGLGAVDVDTDDDVGRCAFDLHPYDIVDGESRGAVTNERRYACAPGLDFDVVRRDAEDGTDERSGGAGLSAYDTKARSGYPTRFHRDL
jgi:hypothetical protein